MLAYCPTVKKDPTPSENMLKTFVAFLKNEPGVKNPF